MAQKWNIKTINGTAPAVPMGLKIGYYTVEMDSGANMEGTMVHNVVNHKYKFFITAPPMNQTDMTTFLTIMKPNDLTIVYYDLFDGTEKTGYFYHGDIIAEPYWIYDENMTDTLYAATEIHLIEN